MKATLLFLLSLAIPVVVDLRAATVGMDWSFEPLNGTWTSKDIGMAMRKSIASFHQINAKPLQEDASGSFGYSGKKGVITLIIEHRLAGGYPGTGDCTAASRNNYLRVMHQNYGKTDSEQSFRLRYSSLINRKHGQGVGTVCHFVSFPTFDGMPVYSEVGVLLIGDFLLEYRGTFVDKAGISDLNGFLSALGVKKS